MIDDRPAAGSWRTEVDSDHGTSPGSCPESSGGREPAGAPPVGAFGSWGAPRHDPPAPASVAPPHPPLVGEGPLGGVPASAGKGVGSQAI